MINTVANNSPLYAVNVPNINNAPMARQNAEKGAPFEPVTQPQATATKQQTEPKQVTPGERTLDANQEKQVAELKQREQEVITHEQAHAAVGGQYAGQPQYEYTEGPDGKRYITGGEVSIDIGKAATPEETLEKMQIVRAAAMAPAEPSVQDRQVAAEAQQLSTEARQEIAKNRINVTSEGSEKGQANGFAPGASVLQSSAQNGASKGSVETNAQQISQYYEKHSGMQNKPASSMLAV